MPDPREPYGRIVHGVRLAFNADLPHPRGVLPWEEREAGQQEMDMRIGAAVAAAERERIRVVLREHYLAGITCDHALKEDNPVCACSRVFLGWHPSIGAAVEAWTGHVLAITEPQERSDGKEASDGEQ